MSISSRLLSLLLLAVFGTKPNAVFFVTSFSASKWLHTTTSTKTVHIYETQRYGSTSTVEAPTRPDTERTTRRSNSDTERRRSGRDRDEYIDNDNNDDDDVTNDLEYYIDPSASREMNEPFHILLMGSATYIKPKVTVPYVSHTLEYVLGMPYTDAYELSQFAHDNDLSCLGTWTREQCLLYGKQLQSRDVICRIVPYCIGGWQAKDTSSSSSSSSSFSNTE
jgi:hypothetical protein